MANNSEVKLYALDMETMKSYEETDSKPKIGKYVILCTMIATVNSILLGYDIGIMSGALQFLSADLNLGLVQEEIIVGSLNLISVVGGAIAGRLSDAIGRKLTMAIAAAIFFIGAVLMAFAPSFAVLLLGRLVAGIGVGFALMIAPVYSAELSPARLRGSLVSLTEVFINFGILLGYLVSFALAGLPNNINWRLMLGVGALPAILLAVGVLVMPESPRWLVTQKRMSQAREVLLKTSNGNTRDANARLREIMETIGFIEPDETRDPTPEEFEEVLSKKKKQGEGVWEELLWKPTPAVRRMLVCALGLHFFQQACGIDAAVYYSPVVFREAGVSSKLGILGATVGVGFCKFSFIFIATALLDHVGRKPLLISSAVGVTLCLFTLGTAFILLGFNSTAGDTLVSVNTSNSKGSSTSKLGPGITIFAICAYVAVFSVGFGPVAWVFVSEIFPLRLRAQAVGLCVVVNRLISGTVALTFLSVSKAITPAGTFFLYGSIVAMSIIFFYVFMPETKGKTLEQLQMFFEGRPSLVAEGQNVEPGWGGRVEEPPPKRPGLTE